jgi:hypothetical protein
MSEKTMPKRLKRKNRVTEIPEGSKFVGRGSRWGNPFEVEVYGRDECIELYRKHITKCIEKLPNKYNLSELKGRDLYCYCKLDENCHGDLLLQMANN